MEKHRKRLVRKADAHTRKLRDRIEQLVGELASTRAELIETRQAAIWAALYPHRQRWPPTTIAGGQPRVLERAHLATQVSLDQVFDLLRADAQFLATALTAEQREAMGMKRDDAAVWSSTPEGLEAERKEKREALKRYRQMWGTEPA